MMKTKKQGPIVVVGGVNMDISANLTAPFVHADSIPGHVELGAGGVARNIAHNLVLMGHEVKFVSLFGGDRFGQMCRKQCGEVGLDLRLSRNVKDARNGVYLCVNNREGDMVVAVADTEIIDRLTPAFLEARLRHLNKAEAVVADTNLPEASLRYLIEHCEAPLCIDTVSTAKAAKVVAALRQVAGKTLHTLKLNSKEAFAITPAGTVEEAAKWLHRQGVEHVYITLGSGGVYCSSAAGVRAQYPSTATRVVNTTGAGDAFLAGVVHGMVSGAAFPLTAHYGLEASRLTLLTPGAVSPAVGDLSQVYKVVPLYKLEG